MNPHKHVISGSCHCGNIAYTLRSETPLAEITLRTCRCDFCLRHRPRYWSDAAGSLDISIEKPQNIQQYRFGHGTADFVLCRNCGVFAFAVTATDAGYGAVTNLNLALKADDALPEVFIEALAETEGERNRRRSRNWTPVSSGWPLS